MEVTLTLDTTAASAAIRRLREVAPLAITRALNRSAASGKTVMVRAMAQDVGMKVGDVRETVTVREARPDRLEAAIVASGKRIPLVKFSAKGPEPSRGRGRGVSYRIGKVRRTNPHAFIATMKSGHRGVFMRTGRARLPITELHGPSLPLVFKKQIPMALSRIREQLTKNLQHEFRYYLQRKAS